MSNNYTSLEQLPLALSAKDVAQVLGISHANAYALMHSKGFPTLKIGTRMDGRRESRVKKFLDDRASGIDTSLNYTFDTWADICFEHHQDNISAIMQESYRYTLRILKDYFWMRNAPKLSPTMWMWRCFSKVSARRGVPIPASRRAGA